MQERSLPLEMDDVILLGQLAEADDRSRQVGDNEGDDTINDAIKSHWNSPSAVDAQDLARDVAGVQRLCTWLDSDMVCKVDWAHMLI